MDKTADPTEVLSAESIRELENQKRWFVYTGLFLLTCGCAGTGLVQALPLPIESWQMIMVSFWIGAFLCAVLGELIVRFLRGHVTTERAIIPTLLIGGVGVLLCSGVLTYALDTSKPVTHEVTLLLRQEIQGKRPVFLMAFKSWMKDKTVITLPVSRQEFNQVQGDHCWITTKAGRFGFEWVASKIVCGQAPVKAKK